MSPAQGKDLAASVRARLLNLAKAEQSDFNGVLLRYTLERLLYRLGQSDHGERFLLKGAMLFTLWYDMPHRPTRDVDLLGYGPSDLPSVAQAFREVAAIAVADGVVFDPSSVSAEDIRKEAGYPGARIFINAELAGARMRVQVDIGFGDAVVPGPVAVTYPVLLPDFPAPQLRAYPVHTVVAEKLHAIALLGMANTRMKDYLDLMVIFERESLAPEILAQAIAATFARRGMPVPSTLPLGLTDAFAEDETRRTHWQAFLRKNDLAPVPLQDVLVRLRQHLQAALTQAAKFQG